MWVVATQPLDLPEGIFRPGQAFRPGWEHSQDGSPTRRIPYMDPEVRKCQLTNRNQVGEVPEGGIPPEVRVVRQTVLDDLWAVRKELYGGH